MSVRIYRLNAILNDVIVIELRTVSSRLFQKDTDEGKHDRRETSVHVYGTE